MSFTLICRVNGEEKRERFSSCYESIIKANKLKKQGLKVKSIQNEYPYVTLKNSYQPAKGKSQVRAIKRHGMGERGKW